MANKSKAGTKIHGTWSPKKQNSWNDPAVSSTGKREVGEWIVNFPLKQNLKAKFLLGSNSWRLKLSSKGLYCLTI